jgi:hypothetical protein
MNDKAEVTHEVEVVATAIPENTITDDPPPEESSTAKVCSWVAFILINIAFTVLMAWGSITYWVTGFGFAVVYTIVLLVSGYLLKRRNGKDSILTSLLFLLAILAIAVSGLYLPLNALPCSTFFRYDDDYYRDYHWVTKTENLPSDVESWWNDHRDYEPSTAASFVYLNNSGVTLFAGFEGSDNYESPSLWMEEDGGAPKMVANITYPKNFVAVDDSTACLSFRANDDYGSDKKIACTNDGVEFNKTEEMFYLRDGDSIKELIYSNDLIWFAAEAPDNSEGWGPVLYSVDPFNLNNVSLYSYFNETNEGSTDDESTDDDCSSEYSIFIRFISLLGLSALPSLIGAIAISFFYKIPSMSVGAYLSTTWIVVCLIFTIDPTFDNMRYFFGWWFVFTTGPWLILLTLAHLTNRITKNRLAWGINFAALVYTIGMFILLLPVFASENEKFWQWAVLTIFVVPPLFVIGVIARQIISMILACIVIMIDVFRLTAYISDVAGIDDSVPVQFVVLGLSGLALGFLGYLLSKRQSRIESAVSKWAKSSLGRWVTNSDGEGMNNVAGDV